MLSIDHLAFLDLPECPGCGLLRPIEPGDAKRIIAGRVDPEWRPRQLCPWCRGTRAPHAKPRKRRGGRYGSGGAV